jgi:hypothetical protein
MSERVPVVLDMSQAEGELANFTRRVEIDTFKASKRVLGTLAAIAAATGTTLGRSISLVIHGAITSAQLLQQLANVQLSNPYTVIFGALTTLQLASLWHSIGIAVGESGRVDLEMRNTTRALRQLTLLTGLVNYR